ncbi:MAG: hypothetical protein ABSC55_11990 [Syntrophorhabdales bacterium]
MSSAINKPNRCGRVDAGLVEAAFIISIGGEKTSHCGTASVNPMQKKGADFCPSNQYQGEIWETGMSSKTYLAVASADDAYDPTRCPRGMYTQMIEEFCWPWRTWPERKWLSMNRVVPGRSLKESARYARDCGLRYQPVGK